MSNLFVVDTASVHTYPTNSAMNPQLSEYALQSGFFKIGFQHGVVGDGRIRIFPNKLTCRYLSQSFPSEIWITFVGFAHALLTRASK